MKLIEAGKVKQVIKDYWKAQVDKALTLTFIDGNEANKRINSYLEHNHDLLKAIDELPSVQPDTTTNDSIPAETGKNDGVETSGDCISRRQAIDKINERQRKLIYCFGFENDMVKIMDIAKSIITIMPSAQPEIIRCKDCKHSRFFDPCFYCYEMGGEIIVPENGFCFKAERKINATDRCRCGN